MKPVDEGILRLAAAQGADEGTGGGTVLLVEDDMIVRLSTAAALAERGWRVVGADSGEQALRMFEIERPQLVALDAVMPGMDGFSTCEKLRLLPGGQHVPVLMLTGLDDDSSIARAYDAGATDFFVKAPGRWTLLSQRLRYLLRAARVREELARSRADLMKTQLIARLGSWRWNAAGGLISLSDQACALLGIDPPADGLPQALLWKRAFARDRVRIARLLAGCNRDQAGLDFECRIRGPQQQVCVVRIEAELQFDEAGKLVSARGALQDVTRDRLVADQIRRLADLDAVTGLPNRRHFQDLFAAELERSQADGTRGALLLVGIFRFRQINDWLGTRVGDELLQQIAQRLQAALRAEGRTAAASAEPRARARTPGIRLARVGGDDFAVLLSDLRDDADIESIGRRLLDVFAEPLAAGSQELFTTASIGATVFPADGDQVDGLMGRADVAMREVEEHGGNSLLRYSARMDSTRIAHWQLESALLRAVGLKELSLAYQPKVDVATGRIVGAEALMRWRHEGASIPPSEFIPAAEDSGLIVPLTDWALAEACRQLDQWARRGLPRIPLSVNISGQHLQRGGLVESVRNALLASGADGRLLELELTETAMMRNLEAVLPQLEAIKALGLALSIDDFGTGYSSIAYLKRLPVDTLKIDRSFVGEIETSRDSAGLVNAILAMGGSLRMQVVAEGVETMAQMEHLARHGCRLMQGYLFSRPIEPEAFARLVEQGTRREWHAPVARDPALTAGGDAPAVQGATGRRR
jgi:predicted signal transduction protein with EAL and GGDEF domain/DNA-binding response OmpR family regulator